MYVQRNNSKEFAVNACGYSNREACVSFLRTACDRNTTPPHPLNIQLVTPTITRTTTQFQISQKKNLSAVLEQTVAAYLTSVLLQSFYV